MGVKLNMILIFQLFLLNISQLNVDCRTRAFTLHQIHLQTSTCAQYKSMLRRAAALVLRQAQRNAVLLRPTAGVPPPCVDATCLLPSTRSYAKSAGPQMGLTPPAGGTAGGGGGSAGKRAISALLSATWLLLPTPDARSRSALSKYVG